MAQQYTFDVNAAIQAGYTPDQIQQYLDQQKQAGNQYQLTQTPQQTPQQSQQPQQGKSNFFADALPTIGGIVGGIAGAAIPVLGETGVGEVGGAAAGSGLGETARELIEGKKLNPVDIGAQTALGGVGGVAGKVLGKVGGAVLSKTGQALENVGIKTVAKSGEMAGNVTPKVFDSVIPDNINYADNLNNLAQTAKSLGLMDGKPLDMLPKVKTASQLIDSQLHSLPEMQQAFNINAANQDFLKQLTDSGIDPSSPKYADAVSYYSKKLLSLGKPAGSENAPQILDATGNVIQTPGNATLKDAYGLKSDIANDDLARVFNKLKSPNGTDLTPEERVQLALWRSVKTSMDSQGTPAIRQLNNVQNQLFDIGKAYAKAAGKNAPNSAFSFKDLFPLAAGGVVGGVPGAVGMEAAAKLASNPSVVGAVGKGVQGAGQVLQNGFNPVVGKVVANTVGQTSTRALLPQSPQSQNETNQENTNTSFNQSNTLPSSPQQAFGNNSTINSTGSQGMGTQQQALTDTLGGSAAAPSGFMQGWTLNGQPVDDATRNILWQIVNYRIDPTKATSLKNNEREKLITMASQVDPTYDQSTFASKNAIMKSYQGGGKGAQTVNALNTAINHLYLLSQNAKDLGNTNFPAVNSIKNTIQTQLGGNKATNFTQTANAVASEMANVMKQSGATDSEISAFKQGFNPNMSPEQMQGVINEMIQLMAGRLQALQGQYENGMGKPSNYSFITPESQRILNTLQNQLPATP